MVKRPTNLPPRHPDWLARIATIVIICLIPVSLALLASQCERAHGQQEPPVPSLTPLTEQQRLSEIIAHLAALGEQLPPESPDHRVSMRRETYQQMLCYLAYHLDLTEDPLFDPIVAEACAAQWAWWPEQAQWCFPCQR